jgi:hypothetical protein
MIVRGDTVTNSAICEEWGVGIMGGIRVSNERNTIVLISKNTDSTFVNTWEKGVLHFVGRGAVGPQKLTAQNRTLARSTMSGARVHLFEVFKKGEYVYAGQVELAGEPYRSEQVDAQSTNRFVWKFPIRLMTQQSSIFDAADSRNRGRRDHLPLDAYAVIDAELNAEQQKLVDGVLDELKRQGVYVLDKRDVDERRHRAALARWHEKVLAVVRRRVRSLISKRKRTMIDPSAFLADDELHINNMSNEQELRRALALLDYDDPAAMEAVFEEARQAVEMPEPPTSLAPSGQDSDGDGSILELPYVRNASRFDGFT